MKREPYQRETWKEWKRLGIQARQKLQRWQCVQPKAADHIQLFQARVVL